MDQRLQLVTSQLTGIIWSFTITFAIGCVVVLLVARKLSRSRAQRRALFAIGGLVAALLGAGVTWARLRGVQAH